MENKIKIDRNKLLFGSKEFKISIGKGGLVLDKKEGDGATPIGCFPIRKVYYRADRIDKPETSLPTQILMQDDGWCDDLEDQNYNKYVKLPYPSSTEGLWREDNLYDIIAILGYNDDPVIAGKGSAIFVHIARENYSPTAGCIALSKSDLLEILKIANSNTLVCVESD